MSAPATLAAVIQVAAVMEAMEAAMVGVMLGGIAAGVMQVAMPAAKTAVRADTAAAEAVAVPAVIRAPHNKPAGSRLAVPLHRGTVVPPATALLHKGATVLLFRRQVMVLQHRATVHHQDTEPLVVTAGNKHKVADAMLVVISAMVVEEEQLQEVAATPAVTRGHVEEEVVVTVVATVVDAQGVLHHHRQVVVTEHSRHRLRLQVTSGYGGQEQVSPRLSRHEHHRMAKQPAPLHLRARPAALSAEVVDDNDLAHDVTASDCLTIQMACSRFWD